MGLENTMQAEMFTERPKNKPCEFSECRKYRYTLWREWGVPLIDRDGFKSEQFLMVIGLNPSTADEKNNDPTVRRCIQFAKDWGFGALCMTNLFAWRDTAPSKMKLASEPVGRDNNRWLQEIGDSAGMILAAWGKHGKHLNRAGLVEGFMPPMKCLVKNADASPKHPLYVPANTIPIDL